MEPKEKPSARIAAPPLSKPPVPRPWWKVFYPLAILTLLGGVTVALAAGVVRQQPAQHAALIPEPLPKTSINVSELLNQALVEGHIPPDNIQRGALESAAANSLPASSFTVQVPSVVDPEALVAKIREDLAAQGVQVYEQEQPEDARLLQLLMGRETVATALLTPQSNLQQHNIQVACTHIANEVTSIFQTQGAQMMLETGPEVRSDDDASWTVSEFRAHFSAPPDPARLRDALTEGLARQDVTLSLQEGDAAPLCIGVKLHGRTVVQVRCVAEQTDAPLAPSANAASEPELPLVLASHSPRDSAVFAPESILAPILSPELPPAEIIAPPRLPPLEDLPLESTVLEDEHLARSNAEHGPPVIPRPPSAEKPRLALIIDDGGYGGERTERLLKLDNRLTLAILPNTPYARQTAERALANGFQVMLHMPMETYGSPFPGEIKTSMPPQEIERLTLDALAQVPGVVGVNNHTGSKFTRDADRMGDFLKVIKPRNLFFIDSITITRSAAYNVAKGMEIPSAQRDIFIDNSSAPDLIRRQLREVIKRAKAHGSAIGIGHFRPNTVRVLENELPRLEEYGVTLVHVSELVR